jgi:hypothetical protein
MVVEGQKRGRSVGAASARVKDRADRLRQKLALRRVRDNIPSTPSIRKRLRTRRRVCDARPSLGWPSFSFGPIGGAVVGARAATLGKKLMER